MAESCTITSMAESCTITDWNNDKSDEIFFSLLGELLQNNIRATELYTLLSSQSSNKSQFQNDNEYRCKEDMILDEDHEESDLNKLVDILKNRLQNGKSVPAGLTQEKLTRLKDDFLKQKEENKRTEQNQNTKKNKNATPPVLVAKPKPKKKKQLQAEQRRRELEMASIAKEIDEKKKKDEEKELFRKKQEKERKRVLEEDLKRQEEDKKRLLMNETKKKKEKEELEKESRNQKEKERQEKTKKMQEEEQRRKEEEKRRKAEEKAAKAKALKEGKEREEREKLEKQQLSSTQKGQGGGKARSQQYQQYQQQQQKYPREVPPRFLRQQQIKQQGQLKDSESCNINNNFVNSESQFRENSNWTEVGADTTSDYNNTMVSNNNQREWKPPNNVEENSLNNINGGQSSEQNNSSWGGVPASEDWDLDISKPPSKPPCSSVINQNSNNSISNNTSISTESRHFENSSLSDLNKPINGKVGNATFFSQIDSPSAGGGVNNDSKPPQQVISNSTDSCWGASLTGSTWDTSNNNNNNNSNSNNNHNPTKQWDESVPQSSDNNSIECNSPSNVSKNNNAMVSNGAPSWCTKYSSKPVSIDSSKSDNPGITPWAGLDSFEGIPFTQDTTVQSPKSTKVQSPSASSILFPGGAKPKTISALSSNFSNNISEPSDKMKHSPHSSLKEPKHSPHNSLKEPKHSPHSSLTKEPPELSSVEQSDSTVVVNSNDNKIDTNLKVTGWLESSTLSDDWDCHDDDKETNDEEFGWTTVQQNKAKKYYTSNNTGNNNTTNNASNNTSSNPQSASVSASPSKSESNNNAWTNRALKQLLDMGFKKEHAEKALRDNNGIIESAVSDLLMKGEMTEWSSSNSAQQQVTSKTDTNNAMSSSCNNNGLVVSQTSTPQKLNRKQRRKLQQMQNAEQQKESSNLLVCDTSIRAAPSSTISSSDNTSLGITASSPTVTMPKSKNDGLLPTPPPSLRLVPNNDDPVVGVDKGIIARPDHVVGLDKSIIARPTPQQQPQSTERNNNNNNNGNSLLKTNNSSSITSSFNSSFTSSACLTPIGQQTSTATKIESSELSTPPPCAPIGSSRPSSIPTPIQPPNNSERKQAVLNLTSSSSSEVTTEQLNSNNNTPLQPPVNPVLLAQMHLQKLGLESTPPPPAASSYSPSSVIPPTVGPPASSQTVTNSMIKQYLQQIAQSSEVEQSTATVSSSPINNTPLHSSTMHLSGLLQQAPVPATSLLEGPQKSKLLQWTQPSSASNSEPTTPLTNAEFCEDPPRESTSPVKKEVTTPYKVDPVSAKWGVVGVPKLLPTPAEFKPGEPWKSQHTIQTSNADLKTIEKDDDDESGCESDVEEIVVQNVVKRASPPNVVKRASPEVGGGHPLTKTTSESPQEIVTVLPPAPLSQPLLPQQPLLSQSLSQQPPLSQQPVMPIKLTDQQPTIRPPPGLGAAVNSFNGMRNRVVDEMNWLIIRGLSSVFDPPAMRSLCQQFGTLLDFRIIGNTIYVRYETHAHAHNARLSLNRKMVYNSQILAEVSTEFECMKAIAMLNSNSVGGVPSLTNHHHHHVTQHTSGGGFSDHISHSSFGGGGLWSTGHQIPQPSAPQSFVQQSFNSPSSYAAGPSSISMNGGPSSISMNGGPSSISMNGGPSSISMNGGPSSISMNGSFAHWGMPNPTTVIPNSNQLWQAAATPQQQPTNVFPTYQSGGWLTNKPADIVPHVDASSIFNNNNNNNPGMDRSLPSELFNAKELGA